VDDVNFNQKTALEWIRIIEDPSASVREKDLYPLLRSWLATTSSSTSSSQSVLDIGCGQGVCSICLENKAISYYGIDPSSDLIHRANELYTRPSCSFSLGNAYAIPFEDTFFEAVFSVAVWHLLSDIAKASHEMSRVLKSKGHFLIFTADPNQYQIWMDRYDETSLDGRRFTGSTKNIDGSTSTDEFYLHSLREITNAFSANGLEVSKIETVRSFVVILGQKS
jgi:ubiquinone/menaquinone biosynthesis C-methylase UbiE